MKEMKTQKSGQGFIFSILTHGKEELAACASAMRKKRMKRPWLMKSLLKSGTETLFWARGSADSMITKKNLEMNEFWKNFLIFKGLIIKCYEKDVLSADTRGGNVVIRVSFCPE